MRRMTVAAAVLVAACGGAMHDSRIPRTAPDELRVTRAVLYQNGIGYFERRGTIRGDRLTIRIRPDQIADFLKSLTVVDMSRDGRAVAVSLPVEKSQSRQLADLPPQVREQGGILAIAAAFRGARATVKGKEGSATGRIVGVERIEVPSKSDAGGPAHEWRLTLLENGGELRTFAVAGITSLKILDKTLTVGLEKALDVTLNEGTWKPIELTVQLAGDGPHEIVVSYVVEMPTWKPAYRVVVEDGGQALLQGWAVVDNVSGEDWYDVKLSLTAGTPLAFAYDLYTPHYVRRPDLSPPDEQLGYMPPMPATSQPAPAYDEEYGGWDAPEAEEAPAPAKRSAAAKPKAPPPPPKPVSTDDLERNYRSLVAGAGVGSLFRYDLETPISVKDRESALVSVVSKKVPGEDVLVFRAGIDAQNPYRSVRLKNETGFVLERGPVAIYRDGTFLGEALTARMEKGSTTFVPYALDSRVDVFLEEEQREEGMKLVTIVNGRLVAESKRVTKYVYEVDNRSGEGATLYVQRARRSGWTITKVGLDGDSSGPPQAGKAGVIEEEWQYYVPIALPASGKVRVAVEEETPAKRNVEMLSAEGRDLIRAYVSSPDADKKVAEALAQAVEISDKLASIDRRIQELEQQRHLHTERENQIRDNLNLLRKSKTNDDLRKQLETRLGEIEKTLDAITREHVQLGEERYKLTEKLAATLKGVTLKK